MNITMPYVGWAGSTTLLRYLNVLNHTIVSARDCHAAKLDPEVVCKNEDQLHVIFLQFGH